MDWVEVTPYGMKNDRVWCIMRESKMKPISNHNSHIPCYLRMDYDPDKKPDEIVLRLKDDKCYPELKKRSHTLYFNNDAQYTEFVEGMNNYRGFLEGKEVNDWLSAIFGEKVFLMKYEKERVMTLDKKI